MKKSLLFLFVSFAFMGVAEDAFAGNADVIFDILASKGGTIGKGLRDTGFLIAGFGLIVFSFMAIFNKISWKMLAYIMFSTFVLSTMIGIIGYISGGQSGQPFPDIQSTGAGGESMDPTQKEVNKETGEDKTGSGISAPMIFRPEEQPSNSLNTPWNNNNQNTTPAQQQPSPLQPQDEQPSWKAPWQ
ncbi:MAG: hypothetical protein IKR92_01215 [Alphaproteobacteria bacterium]|nr:hypothetical protein [Alphaproteobacteria bacterium]